MFANWKHAAHLIRPAVVFLAALVLFAFVRKMVVPPSYGALGPYRAAALDDIRSRSLHYAGHAACADCHTEQVDTKSKGAHKTVNCEACHGPAFTHTQDPSAQKPPRPDTAKLCARCHEADTAKPAWFKQVITKEHSGGQPCGSCHQPHSPKI